MSNTTGNALALYGLLAIVDKVFKTHFVTEKVEDDLSSELISYASTLNLAEAGFIFGEVKKREKNDSNLFHFQDPKFRVKIDRLSKIGKTNNKEWSKTHRSALDLINQITKNNILSRDELLILVSAIAHNRDE